MKLATVPRSAQFATGLRRASLLVLGLLALLCDDGQLARAQQFSFRAYDQNDGLGDLAVLELFRDRSGLMWAGTEEGLFRYNGFRFERMDDIPPGEDAQIDSALEDSAGRIWIATPDGIRLREAAGWKRLEGDRPLPAVGLGRRMAELQRDRMLAIAGGRLYSIQPDEQRRWRVRPFFDEEQLAAHAELSHLGALSVDARSGTIWLACDDKICAVREGRLRIWGPGQGLPADLWITLSATSDGSLWVRGMRHIAELPAGADRFEVRDSPDAVLDFFVPTLDIIEDRRGGILTSGMYGMLRWDGRSWRSFGLGNGIPTGITSGLAFDAEGTLWFATSGRGVRRWLGYDAWQSWTTAQGLVSDTIWSVIRRDASHIWIGSDLGIDALDENSGKISPIAPPAGHRLRNVYNLQRADDGTIWATSDNEWLFRYPPGGAAPSAAAHLPGVRRLAFDSAGRLLAVTGKGLFAMAQPKRSDALEELIEFDSARLVRDLLPQAGGALLMVGSRGVSRFDGGRIEDLRLPGAATTGYLNGHADADGSLWLGGQHSGLQHLRVVGGELKAIPHEGAGWQELSNIVFVRGDRRGWLWAGGDRGVAVYDGHDLRRFDQSSGLIWNDCNEAAFLADDDGSVWIGTGGGLSHFLNPGSAESAPKLQVLILDASIGGRAIIGAASPRAPWGNAELSLKFGTPNFSIERAVRFRYRLQGIDEDWQYSDNNELRYPPLPPGEYRFEVSAIDPLTQRQSALAAIEFSVSAPWWRTPWAYAAGLIMAALAIHELTRWRTRLLLRQRAILRKLVAERTHELERDKRELMKAREALMVRATRDSLTGLWNRAAILEILEKEIRRAAREGATLAVILLDLDLFKQVNDTHGHLAGDQVLRDCGARLLAAIRPSDWAGRYGGEEILAIMTDLPQQIPCPDIEAAQRALSDPPYEFDGTRIRVTASLGVAWMDAGTTTPERLLAAADEALYRAKTLGRNRVCYAGAEDGA